MRTFIISPSNHRIEHLSCLGEVKCCCFGRLLWASLPFRVVVKSIRVRGHSKMLVFLYCKSTSSRKTSHASQVLEVVRKDPYIAFNYSATRRGTNLTPGGISDRINLRPEDRGLIQPPRVNSMIPVPKSLLNLFNRDLRKNRKSPKRKILGHVTRRGLLKTLLRFATLISNQMLLAELLIPNGQHIFLDRAPCADCKIQRAHQEHEHSPKTSLLRQT